MSEEQARVDEVAEIKEYVKEGTVHVLSEKETQRKINMIHYLLSELERTQGELQHEREECKRYRQESINERVLTQSIVGEREELYIENESLDQQLQSAQQEIERITQDCTEENLCRECANKAIEGYKLMLAEAVEREQKLIEGLREVYALIENVEDYTNVKYARDEIERLFKELGVTE